MPFSNRAIVADSSSGVVVLRRSFARLKRDSALVVRGLLCCSILALPLLARGALVWDTQEIKREAKATDREIVALYHFRNAGNSAVAIIDVVSNCDCTTTELTQRAYAPGEAGTLTARLAIGNRSGVQENTLAVITDDAAAGPILLRFRADIQSLVALSPSTLTWRIGADPGDTSTLVRTATSLRMTGLAVTGTYPSGAAAARVDTLTNGTEYRVTVRPASTSRTLNFTVTCSAAFEDGTAQEFTLYGMVKR